jgi:hypothetical protein
MTGYEMTLRGFSLGGLLSAIIWGTAEQSGGVLSCLEPRWSPN